MWVYCSDDSVPNTVTVVQTQQYKLNHGQLKFLYSMMASMIGGSLTGTLITTVLHCRSGKGGTNESLMAEGILQRDPLPTYNLDQSNQATSTRSSL